MVSSSLILQHLHLILGWPPSSSTDLYDHRAPALSLSPWASLPEGECHWLWVWARSGKCVHGLDPEWQPHSVSHLPYLKPINCWTGFTLTNILLTQAALAESLSSLIQTSTLLKFLGNYPILSLNLRSRGIQDRNHRFWWWPQERSLLKEGERKLRLCPLCHGHSK